MNRLRMLTALLASVCASAAFAQSHGPVEISDAVQQDVLGSLRDVKPNPADYHKMKARAEHDLPLPHVPDNQKDGALQGSGTQSLFTPTASSNFAGLGNGFPGFTVQYAPPDTVGAVGATQYVQVVNVGLVVFDKSTNLVVLGPVPTSSLWSGFGGGCQTNNDGDATVVYDKAANRWIISQFSVSTTPYLQCVAVSQTSDAKGAWNRYAFSYGNTAFPDYPKTGVWPDGYYTTFNIFNGNTFGGAKLCAYDRAKMLVGAAATQQCFQLSTSYGGVLPSDADGATAPPAGSPNYMMNFGSNSLNLWKFHVDWTTPTNTTLTGPTNMGVAAFTPACNGGACIPQPANQKLDSLADRLMYRLAYRNFGDHEALVVTHSVNPTPTVKNPKQQSAAVRWYEIRKTGTTVAVYQTGTYWPDSTARWMGSIAMDKLGDIALGYSASSSSSAPSVRYTGRAVGDTTPLGTMGSEVTLFSGAGSQTGSNLSRWGDYSAMTLDPGDDCTFWFTTEYIPSNGAFNWSTRIGSFKFPGCN
jgi:hypothetical protein